MSESPAQPDRTPPYTLVDEGRINGVGATVRLDRVESRHLGSVLRRRPGDEVMVLDGAGVVARAVIVRGGRELEITVEDFRHEPPTVAAELGLALGVLHGQAMDWAIQKAVELGVGRLVPLLSERSQHGRRASEQRCDHWHRLARQALKQCRRSHAMEITPPQSLAELLPQLEAGHGAFGDPAGPWCSLMSEGKMPRWFLAGPEGGFTTQEIAMLRDAGLSPVRLAPHVLRADTAAAVGAAWLVARHAGRWRDDD